MASRWVSHFTVLASVLLTPLVLQSQQTAEEPLFRSTSSLVFLDVTVVDKQGHPVVKGLTQDDFVITEDKKPQRISSFEAPALHASDLDNSGENPDGKASVTIFVMDMLNSSFTDFAFIRNSVHRYLESQPEQLASPAELMVVGNDTLEMLAGWTRNRDDLIQALNHMPPVLPYKRISGSFDGERFVQSIQALQEISLQNHGIPGRKNIVWVGHGGPGINPYGMPVAWWREIEEFAHDTTNMLVDSRMSLFVIYPGLKVRDNRFSGTPFGLSSGDAMATISDGAPFSGDINFGVFANETGGDLFYNRNDADALIRKSQQLGSQYYTLTYHPPAGPDDGKFRRIRVTLRDPRLHAITKAGYYAPDKNALLTPRQREIVHLADAANSEIAYVALPLKLATFVRSSDNRTADLIVQLPSQNLNWQNAEDGMSAANIMIAIDTLGSHRHLLSSRLQTVRLHSQQEDAAQHDGKTLRLKFNLRIPQKTERIRLVVQADGAGQVGSVELDRAAIDVAPAPSNPSRPKAQPATAGD